MVDRKKKLNNTGLVIVVILCALYIIFTAHVGRFFISGEPNKNPLVYIAYILIALAIIRNPMIGFMLVVLLIPFKIKFIKYVSVREAVGWITFISWFWRAIRSGKFKVSFEWPEKILLLLFFLSILSIYVNAAYGPYYIAYFLTFIASIFFYFLTVQVLDNYEKINTALLMIAASGAISSIYGINALVETQAKRMYGFSKDPNYLAFIMAIVVPYVLLKTIYSKVPLTRVLYFGLITVLIGGVAFTASRSVVAIAPVSLIVLFFLEKKKFKLIILAVTVFATSVFLARFLPTERFIARISTLEQLKEPGDMDDASLGRRYEMIPLGLRTVAEHPLIGVGAGTGRIYDYIQDKADVLHNAYLQLACETGIPALLIYVLLFLLALRQQWQLRKTAIRTGDEDLYILSTTFFLGFLSIVIFNFVFILIIDKLYCLWLGMAVALDRITREKLRGDNLG